MTDPKKMGMLRDHNGKRSASRGASLFATITLCIVAIGQVFVPSANAADPSLLIALTAVAVGPIAANRAWGEYSPTNN